MSKMSKMYIREATLADIPRLAEIWSIAFFDDAFYNTVFPRRHEFLDDYRNMWTKKLRKRFLQRGEQYIVSETDVVDTNGRSRTEVTGWASWVRMGSSKAAEKIAADGESILRGVERKLFSLEETLIHPLLRFLQNYPGDRFADAEALEKFYEEYALYVDEFWIGDIEEHWHLKMLAVDPKWQRNGIGQMLVRWGLEKAQQEDIPAGLESTDAGGPIYLKLGFVEIKRLVMLEGRVIFPILLWRPKSGEGVLEKSD